MAETFEPAKGKAPVNPLETSLAQADAQGDLNPATTDPSGALLEAAQADATAGGKTATAAAKAETVPESNPAVTDDSGLSMGDVAMAGALIVGGAIASRTPLGKQLYAVGEQAVSKLATKVTGIGDVSSQASVLGKFGDSFPTLSTGLEDATKLAVNRLSTLQGGGRAFLHGDGTVVARADEVLPFYGSKVSGIEAINPAGNAMRILK